MARKLPSLNQLRAFEAAARHESIKDGARELCVTPAAVGHQIRALEESLQISLFHRGVRQITLTEDGRTLAKAVGEALDTLEAAVAPAFCRDLSGTLRISVAPFFGNRWLLPRLPDFCARYPDITVEPSLSFDYVDLTGAGFDAAVRYGHGDWAGLSSDQIFRDRLRPVCAPQLLGDRAMPLPPGDVLTLPLAAARQWPDDWAAWAMAGGVSLPDTSLLQVHDSRAFMFDAALSGQAVILADARMTGADEAAGRLICLSPVEVDRPQGIHVVTAAGPDNGKVRAFTDWMKSQAQT